MTNESPMRRAPGMLPLLVFIVIIVGAFAFFTNARSGKAVSNKNAYHAVFLTNNQVYFGKVTSAGSEYVELADIYYLQLNQQLQPIAEEDQKKEGQTEEQKSQFALIKLGKELHGPTDKMVINRDHVLFIEELKSDSRVVEAINKVKGEQKTEDTKKK